MKTLFKDWDARCWLYFLIPLLMTFSVELATYSEKPPDGWAIAALLTLALANAFVAVRGYMDQHLSNEKEKETVASGTGNATL